jgi:hypothetical protein
MHVAMPGRLELFVEYDVIGSFLLSSNVQRTAGWKEFGRCAELPNFVWESGGTGGNTFEMPGV